VGERVGDLFAYNLSLRFAAGRKGKQTLMARTANGVDSERLREAFWRGDYSALSAAPGAPDPSPLQ